MSTLDVDAIMKVLQLALSRFHHPHAETSFATYWNHAVCITDLPKLK